MSSPEYAELRGVSGVAVAQRAALLETAEKRSLIWFLQGMSLQPGGLKKVAADLIAMFPENICQAKRSRWDARGVKSIEDTLPKFLEELCINPRLRLVPEAEGERYPQIGADINLAREEFPDIERTEFRAANAPGFNDVLPALSEYKKRYEDSLKSDFVITSNGRLIWDAFDRAVKTRRIALVNGREGLGKTEAAKAWCNCHLGEARFVSLKGITNRKNAFRGIGKALGVACGTTRKAAEMQDRIEDVLQRSKLLLVIDESHLAFNQSERVYKRPELVDWIVTLNNERVPIALVTTPHFFTCVERAAGQTGWNWHQFKRRIRPYIELKPTPAPEIENVARKLVPYASKQMISFMLGYAKMARRDLSGLADLVEEARLRCEAAGRPKIAFEDLDGAVMDSLTPADAVFLNLEKRIEAARKHGRRTAPNPPADAPSMFDPRVISPGSNKRIKTAGRNGRMTQKQKANYEYH